MTSEQPWIPAVAERARRNADLLAHGIDTGWYDARGVPAPWPDDIEEWRPATHQRTPLNPNEQPF